MDTPAMICTLMEEEEVIYHLTRPNILKQPYFCHNHKALGMEEDTPIELT